MKIRSRRFAASVATLAVGAIAVLGACTPAPSGRPVVGIYGDSMAFQSAPWSDAALNAAGHPVVSFRFPGLAACDLVRPITDDLHSVAKRPSVVVVVTTGNSLTPCMKVDPSHTAAPGSPDYFEKYRAALDQIATAADSAGVPFVFTWGPMPGPKLTLWNQTNHLGLVAEQVAAAHTTMVVRDTSASVLDADGQLSTELPCASEESSLPSCVDGRTRIRASELDPHFYCPVSQALPSGWPRACPVDSPGGRRYGNELASVAVASLRPGSS